MFDGNFQPLFWMSFIISFLGILLDLSLDIPKKEFIPNRKMISLDRFFLLAGWREALTLLCFAFSYGIVSTYVAIYGKECLGITSGTGLFFSLLAVGLILSRLTGSKALRENRVTRNATMGMLVSVFGYLLFAAVQSPIAYYGSAFIIGLGNGHMYPAFLNMFINLARHDQRGTANSSILTSWDAGVGLGVLTGGLLSEHLGYASAFWGALAINVAGIILYFAVTRAHFEKNKLR